MLLKIEIIWELVNLLDNEIISIFSEIACI